jgi:2-polyprenyl-6-methoxyphenol hydroxylase-like FAD-dependent oxidoreductase
MNWSGKVERKITRREFVKKTTFRGAAALAIGSGGVALSMSAKANQPKSKMSDTIHGSKPTFFESGRELSVIRQADVVVVGGGPAGVAAALAAARNGAETVLVERYGHLGGMATGGLVICIMPMTGGTKEQQIAGICQEIVDRLDALDAAIHPPKKDLGTNDINRINYWRPYPFFVVDNRVRLSVLVDPEMLKCVMNDMIEEAGVKLLLHSWVARAIVEDDVIQGIILESKSGRQAILSKLVIDATGDGDVFASAGAEYDGKTDPNLRSSKMALVFQVAHIDAKKFSEFQKSDSQEFTSKMQELERLGGFTMPLRSTRDDVMWFNNHLPGMSTINVEDLTWVEVNGRKMMLRTHDFFKKHIPGFENSFIMNTAYQVGVRGSRRLIGEYIVTENDIRSGTVHEDTIAVCPPFLHNVSLEKPCMHIPYRTLVPRKVENLLVAGRCFSSDLVANDLLSPIQFCMAMGQAAGTAAALSIRADVGPRSVDHRMLQDYLMDQGVPLPGITRAG